MTTSLSPHRVGLAFGAMLGLIHLGWSVLVAASAAQPLTDWVFRLHMIQPVYQIGPFSFLSALVLVVATAVVGYVAGYIFALLWNALHKA